MSARGTRDCLGLAEAHGCANVPQATLPTGGTETSGPVVWEAGDHCDLPGGK